MVAAVAFWPCAFAMLLVRRGRVLEPDHVLVRYGYWLSIAVTSIVFATQ